MELVYVEASDVADEWLLTRHRLCVQLQVQLELC
jgi:hypothetical protein